MAFFLWHQMFSLPFNLLTEVISTSSYRQKRYPGDLPFTSVFKSLTEQVCLISGHYLIYTLHFSISHRKQQWRDLIGRFDLSKLFLDHMFHYDSYHKNFFLSYPKIINLKSVMNLYHSPKQKYQLFSSSVHQYIFENWHNFPQAEMHLFFFDFFFGNTSQDSCPFFPNILKFILFFFRSTSIFLMPNPISCIAQTPPASALTSWI